MPFSRVSFVFIVILGLFLGESQSNVIGGESAMDTKGVNNSSHVKIHNHIQEYGALLPRIDEPIIISIVACGDPQSKYVSMLKRLLLSITRNKVGNV